MIIFENKSANSLRLSIETISQEEPPVATQRLFNNLCFTQDFSLWGLPARPRRCELAHASWGCGEVELTTKNPTFSTKTLFCLLRFPCSLPARLLARIPFPKAFFSGGKERENSACNLCSKHAVQLQDLQNFIDTKYNKNKWKWSEQTIFLLKDCREHSTHSRRRLESSIVDEACCSSGLRPCWLEISWVEGFWRGVCHRSKRPRPPCPWRRCFEGRESPSSKRQE